MVESSRDNNFLLEGTRVGAHFLSVSIKETANPLPSEVILIGSRRRIASALIIMIMMRFA